MRFWLTSLAILAELLVISTAASHRDAANEAGNDVCVKQECYDTASRIKNSMNLDVDPCDDFYEYSCGGFIKNAIITRGVDTENLDIVKEQLYSQLKALLETDDEIDDIKPFKQAKTLYKSCINEDAIEAKGVLRLKQFTETFGGWPVVEGASWKESNFDSMTSIADWYRAGLQPNCFINISMEEDSENKSRRVISLNSPYSPESAAIYHGFTGDTEIKAAMVDIAVRLGADEETAKMEIERALRLEKDLAPSIAELIRSTKDNERRMTLNELIKLYPTMDWRNIFARMYSPIQTIDDSDVVVVKSPETIDRAIRLISTTPKRDQANFAMFQIIREIIQDVNQETKKQLTNYMSWLGFRNVPRVEKCVDLMRNSLPTIVAAMYMKKLFTSEKKAYAEYMLREIKQEFRANFDKVSFLDDAQRMFAKDKESAIKNIIGYPKEALDNDYLNDYYRDLEFLDNEYLTNYLRLKKFNFEKEVGEFPKRLDKIYPASVGNLLNSIVPYNDYPSNTIVLPANIFQGNLFDLERPDYMKFGTMGVMIASQLTQIFSSPSNRYDANGARKEWWKTADKQTYDDRTTCFVEQYENSVADNIDRNVDESETPAELIAKSRGVKTTYHAYVNSMRGKTAEKRLPGLDHSPNQMFWIAFANMFCQKLDPLYWILASRNEDLPPNHLYVTGTLSNSEEFAKDFHCQPGSKMNPVKKCHVW